MMNSAELFERAKRSLVGGVNSPVRSWRGVGGTPLFFQRGEGPFLHSVDGGRYTDYVCSWGPLILGHAHPEVVEAVCVAARESTSFGAPCPKEVELAEEVRRVFPSMELARFVSSGTEAVMTALRLARGFTGREIVLKFDGCYHGHSDGMLVSAGSGALTLGKPDSGGVPESVASTTLVVPYNDLERVSEAFDRFGGRIAAVIVEPWAGNMGLVPPIPANGSAEGFLEGLRRLTSAHDALLIFDEVITGFRVPEGGVQQRTGVTPDLTCLGKIIGGGLPVGALGGRREICEHLAPLGPVYQAGTLSGNPLAMASGLAVLRVLRREGVYDMLEERAKQLADGMSGAAANAQTAQPAQDLP
ncbi:MAG TPA: glutamate-1-semialdehyde 2,1-aminomutase, partial [Synergistales bacterium]|nr:glutamate-1-semialdehyde 2,1-aminomutase [Synergistales bacterium]